MEKYSESILIDKIIELIQNKVLSSPTKYEIRRFCHIFTESSIAQISYFKKLRYKIYRCIYDMGKVKYLGQNITIKRPHNTNHGELVVGNNVIIGQDCQIDYTGGILIEDWANISDRVILCTHNHPSSCSNNWPGYRFHHIYYNHLTICNKAWIGYGSIILPNTTRIGKYATVAAGSVVTRNVPDYAVVAGNPARIIGYKEKEEQILS